MIYPRMPNGTELITRNQLLYHEYIEQGKAIFHSGMGYLLEAVVYGKPIETTAINKYKDYLPAFDANEYKLIFTNKAPL